MNRPTKEQGSPGHDELRRWREQGRAPAGGCPFCASRISVIERDGVFVARCSHRGCGARGPKHHDLTRACDLFCCPPQRTAGGMGDAGVSAEVRALREELGELRAVNEDARRLNDMHDALAAKLARVEALPDRWRTDLRDDRGFTRVCADELEAALRGDR